MEYKPIGEYMAMIKNYVNEHSATIKKGVLTGLAGLVMTLGSGCDSNMGFAVDVLKIKVGHKGAMFVPDTSRTASNQALFEKDTQPYDKSEISNGAFEGINPTLWKNYNTRNQK